MILLDPEARPVIAHRGTSGEYPENTLLAFQRALEQGADALELDVQVTADGVPVVIHDSTVDRTTGGTGAVAALTAAQLGELDAGAGERVPQLAEVLERFPDTPLVVELKAVAAGAPVAALLRRYGAAPRTLVAAFQHRAFAPLRGPEFYRGASRRETAAFSLATRLRLPVGAPPYHAFAVPERRRRLRLVDAAFVRAARRCGLPVHVWTVNDPEDARRLRVLGVCGIITDYPARMRDL